MTRPLSDDELRDLLRTAYAPAPRAPRRTRSASSVAWSVALLLVGAAAGAVFTSRPDRDADVAARPRDPVVAVQDAGSRYAEALVELAAVQGTSPDSAAVAREVVATSLLAVTRSLLTTVGDRPEALGLFRLASDLRRDVLPPAAADRGAAF
jgi:hypothetical protein